jgi:thiol-disulfide isomerase/thioredoxin
LNTPRSCTQRTRRGTALLLSGLAATLFLLIRPSLAAAQNPIPADNTPAPEFVGGTWLNTSKGQPIKLAGLKGKVILVHFWTFGCINCKHNLPIYDRWQKQFENQDVAILGVHTPETSGEAVTSRVSSDVKRRGITYPILVDNRSENWTRWHQRYWPCVYLLDKRGRIRYRWEGELEYDHAGGEAKMARKVEELLKESAK